MKYLYRALRYRFLLNPNELAYLSKKVKKGDTVIDIGCHKGGYLYWLRKWVGKSGKVYGFEPQPELFSGLQAIAAQSSYKNVVIENLGISSTEGSVNFHIPVTASGSSPGASIEELKEDRTYQTITINTVSLDTYFYDNDIIPSCIKIDVEGHEANVILGGRKLLKKHHPLLLIECENRHLAQGDVFDVFKLIEDLGYHGYFFDKKILKPIREFKPTIHQQQLDGQFWREKEYLNNFIFTADQ